MDRVAGELAPSAARRAGYVWEAVGTEASGATPWVPAGAAAGLWAPGPAVTPFPEPTSPGSGSSPPGTTGVTSSATGSVSGASADRPGSGGTPGE
jgi:hypothetical protein